MLSEMTNEGGYRGSLLCNACSDKHVVPSCQIFGRVIAIPLDARVVNGNVASCFFRTERPATATKVSSPTTMPPTKA